MHDEFDLTCPSCRSRLRARSRLIGQYRTCPSCRRPLLLRPDTPDDAEPMLVREEWGEEAA